MKPPCHTSSQVKHKQSQQQLLKVIKLIKNFAALLLYANLHSLTHPPTPLPPLITNLSRLNNSNNKDNNNNNNDDDTRTPHNVTKLIMLKRRSSTLRQRRRKFSWSESQLASQRACVRGCVCDKKYQISLIGNMLCEPSFVQNFSFFPLCFCLRPGVALFSLATPICSSNQKFIFEVSPADRGTPYCFLTYSFSVFLFFSSFYFCC